jgi:tripartite-type tricarboxylate transporter receptor subunit TctC
MATSANAINPTLYDNLKFNFIRDTAPVASIARTPHVMVVNPSTTIQQIRAGKLRALAVTSETRSQALPELPTIGEFVPGYEVSTWNGLVAPMNTPGEIIDKIYKEIDRALADPETMTRFAEAANQSR